VLAGVFLWLATGRVPSRRVRRLVGALAAVAAIAFVNFGFFHVHYRSPVHWWDAYHYFMGAKYLPELGYTRLYEATWLAGREMGAFAGIREVRDLTTYALRDVATIDAAGVRARFAPARWAAFKRDLLVFGPRLTDWTRVLVDHGYNDPPPRALLLHALVRWVPATPLALALVTSLDYVVMLAAFLAVRRAFGDFPAALSFAFFTLNFFARFDFIGGSLLRWDWIAAVLLGVSALARGAGATAGVCLGYAVLARIFPVLFLVPLGVKWLQSWLGRRPSVTVARCVAMAGVVIVVAAVGLAGVPAARDLGTEFAAKIRVHNQGVYTNHVGLGSLLTFHATPWIERADGGVEVDHRAALAARPGPWVAPAATLAYLLAALPLMLRARPLESMMYAVPLVFVALSPAGYYYSFLVLLVLLPWQEGANPVRLVEMALLALASAAGYAFEIASHEYLPLFYRATLEIGLFFVVWLGLEYARLVSPESRPRPFLAPSLPTSKGG
jgi:hypothetical protein